MATFLTAENYKDVNADHIVSLSSRWNSKGKETVTALMINGDRIDLRFDSNQINLALADFVPVQGYSLLSTCADADCMASCTYCTEGGGIKYTTNPIVGLYIWRAHNMLLGVLSDSGEVKSAFSDYSLTLLAPNGRVTECDVRYCDIPDWLEQLKLEKESQK
jgi:hypothetical protein